MPIMTLNAKHYEENSTFQKSVANELMALFPPKKTDHILDIGCGDGYLSSRLATVACSGKVTAIDPCANMIRHAKNTYPLTQYRNLHFKLGKAEDTHGVNCYSLITAFNCLHWSNHLEDTFKHCFDALKPGGRVLGITYPKKSEYWQPFLATLSNNDWQQYLPITPVADWLTTKEYSSLLSSIGFKIHFLKDEICSASYQSRNELSDYIKGWLSCLLPINEKKQNEYLQDVLNLIEEKYKNDLSINIPYTKLSIFLEK